MPKEIDLGELLERNPNVDRSQLEACKDFIDRIRLGELGRKTYDLATPFGGRRVAVQDNAHHDPHPFTLDASRASDRRTPRN